MARRAVEEPSLTPTAQPVDRFVQPQMEEAAESGFTQLAQTLSRVNPRLQNFLVGQNNENARAAEAAGMMAESNIDQELSLAQNGEGWKQLIAQARQQDQEQGTNNATLIAGSSPHFRRGLVKARAERLGRGLQQHLTQLWNENSDGIKGVDNLEEVQRWAAEKAQAYGERVGINGIDPVIASEAYLPFVSRAQDKLMGHHSKFRAQQRVQEYEGEFSSRVGWLAHGGDVGDSAPTAFLRRLTMSESSGDPGSFRTNKDGRSFGGLVQMGQARLNDWADATGNERITVSEYAALDDRQQMAIARWHIADIDREIDESGYLQQGMSRDGLRAVAHLGGKDGMHEWVKGGYNPSDELGTSLDKYYRRFASPSSGMQNALDDAVQAGMDPKKANEQLVTSVVQSAIRAGDPSIMAVLDEVSTGSGPLGNIGWVKEQVNEAVEQISDEQWETEQREIQVSERQRKQAKEDLTVGGFNAIHADPFADHSEMIRETRNAGFPDLAERMRSLQRTLQQEDREIVVDHGKVMEIRTAIMEQLMPRERLMGLVIRGVEDGSFSSNTGQALMDDIQRAEDVVDYATDSSIREAIREGAGAVEAEFTGGSGMFDTTGSTRADAQRKSIEFRNELYDELMVFREDNPEASLARTRQFMRKTAADLVKSERYQMPEQEYQPTELDGGGSGASSGPPGTNNDDGDDGPSIWQRIFGGGEEEDGSVNDMSIRQLRELHAQYVAEKGDEVTLEAFIDQLQ